MKNKILHEDNNDDEKEAENAEREKEIHPELSYGVTEQGKHRR